jgi:hypothetical protein
VRQIVAEAQQEPGRSARQARLMIASNALLMILNSKPVVAILNHQLSTLGNASFLIAVTTQLQRFSSENHL